MYRLILIAVFLMLLLKAISLFFNIMFTGVTGAQVDLSAAMDMEYLQSVVENTDALSQLERHLPISECATDSTPATRKSTVPDNLKDTITSPQFRQAVSMFSRAFQTGQMGSVIRLFDLGEGAVIAANQGNMEKFLRALQQANISAKY